MSHTVITSQQIDGWRAVCADCDWRYDNTSASITRRAAEQHTASTEPAPAAPLERAVIPCPECRSELYDRVVWDEGQQLPVCPDCGADVSAGDVDRLRDTISALLDKASDPITVDPRGKQDRYALVPWYLIEDLRKALGPVASDQGGGQPLLTKGVADHA